MPRCPAVSCKDCGAQCSAHATNYTRVCLEGWRSIRRRVRISSRCEPLGGLRELCLIEWRCPACWGAYMRRGGYTMTRSPRRRAVESERIPMP